MTENFDHILLFKTNINCQSAMLVLHAVLDGNPDIEQWTVDLDDEDYVLRVVSYKVTHQQIIALLNKYGYNCCELT